MRAPGGREKEGRPQRGGQERRRENALITKKSLERKPAWQRSRKNGGFTKGGKICTGEKAQGRASPRKRKGIPCRTRKNSKSAKRGSTTSTERGGKLIATTGESRKKKKR